MNKNVMIGIMVAIVLIAIGYFIFSGSTEESIINPDNATLPQKETNTKTSIFSGSKTTSKEVSELIFDLSELPEGFRIAERTPLLESEAENDATRLGWKEGYYVRYLKGTTLFDTSKVELSISKYPVENISKIWELEPSDLEGYKKEKLPDPEIGDFSYAGRLTDEEFGVANYIIEFSKKDIFVQIIMGGNTDYELLKELAKKVADKI